MIPVYCTCAPPGSKPEEELISIPTGGPYFAADLTNSVGVSTGRRRTLAEIEAVIEKQRQAYEESIHSAGSTGPIADAIETTLGWDTIYDPSHDRVISPVSRVWSVAWGGYVIFDWDTFFAATMAGIGDRDLAYANAIEMLREETSEGFVPNYARANGWKSFDRSEPPVGSITVLGLYRKFHDRWFVEDAFEPLLRWNRWWAAHRDVDGYLAWGSDGENQPGSLDDNSREREWARFSSRASTTARCTTRRHTTRRRTFWSMPT
jgi:putative isomerase